MSTYIQKTINQAIEDLQAILAGDSFGLYNNEKMRAALQSVGYTLASAVVCKGDTITTNKEQYQLVDGKERSAGRDFTVDWVGADGTVYATASFGVSEDDVLNKEIEIKHSEIMTINGEDVVTREEA